MKITIIILASIVFVFATTSLLRAKPLDVGDAAPSVSTVDQNGKAVDLGKALSKGTSLVYFYPKADTPGCTKQACNLRDEFEAVTQAGITVYGVSADTAEDQKAFEEKYKLPFILLADKEGAVIKGFGVPAKLGKFAARQSFLIKDGKIVWRDLKAKPTSQAQDAIAAAKAH